MSDKLTKKYILDNINEFYEELNSALNPTLTKYSVWNTYYKEQMRQKECDEISNAYNTWNGGRYICNKVTDNIFVVTRNFTGD